MSIEILLGNEAIALGLVECGVRVATAYPGTPSSEILAAVRGWGQRLGRDVYCEWSTNEKIAFEVALAASWAGLRSAVAMKQVGLNVASDPLFSSAYTGVRGGFVVIPADDPGPHSSQTEQDSRLLALSAKVPVFDPSTPAEARRMVETAFSISERFSTPVILRPTTRLCHALQSLSVPEPSTGLAAQDRSPRFRKDPSHWAATPRARHRLHVELNQKLKEIEAAFEQDPLNRQEGPAGPAPLGVIASGVAHPAVQECLAQMGVQLPVLKLGTPYPLPRQLIKRFLDRVGLALVLEEPDACIELQMPDRSRVRGRLDGTVPAAGELAPEVIYAVVEQALAAVGISPLPSASPGTPLRVEALPLPARPPRLCPGCAHRSAFFALKREFGPQAIYASDIGCYTLGMNLRAVDTFLDMGAGITLADGLYKANQVTGDDRPIIATIGDSTFLHSGLPPLINAVHTGARFVLVILDNHTTAMTGFQPTAASPLREGGATRRVSLAELARACGATFVETTSPYDHDAFRAVARRAFEHSQADGGGVAVVIADWPCILDDPSPNREHPVPVEITQDCDGCRYCIEAFECPALVLRADGTRVDIDRSLCIDCGQCIDACYKGFIVPRFAAAGASIR
jgi:indolepyruvate ferredoxin oxidoreductase alpha subunit